MTRIEILSATFSALALIAVPVLFWTVTMYHTLQSTGAMLAAFA
jgi:hypothetical protein